MPTPRFASVEALTSAEALSPLLGPVARVSCEAISTVGFSGARHERVLVELEDGTRRSFVLKRARPDRNWIARRSGDPVGREAVLLAEPALVGVWDVFASPYVAFASSDGEIGLLMDDLADVLPPDVQQPISEPHEERMLAALAALHAAYWESDAARLPWLATAESIASLLAPSVLEDPEHRESIPPPLRERVCRGWDIARARLPFPVWRHLSKPASDHARSWRALPRTVLHGDAKVANFAPLPDGRLAAFDWEMIASAPATFELCWYLLVNATRLARPRDVVIGRYRALLEGRLGRAVEDEPWGALLDAGILGGATMLLWSKALALEAGRPGSDEEWAWWTRRLESLA